MHMKITAYILQNTFYGVYSVQSSSHRNLFSQCIVSETRGPLDMCPFFLPGWLPSHVSLRSPLLLSLVYTQCLFQCIFYKSVFFWINLSTSACVLSVRLTPPSCLLDLFIMPARGDCVSNTINLFFFSVRAVTWEASLRDRAWGRLISTFSSAVSVFLNLQVFSFSLNRSIFFHFMPPSQALITKNIKSWNFSIIKQY